MHHAFVESNGIKDTEDIPALKGGKSPNPKKEKSDHPCIHDLTGPEEFIAIYETDAFDTDL